MKFVFVCLFAALFCSSSLFAAEPGTLPFSKHGGTDAQLKRAVEWNRSHRLYPRADWNVQRPFSEIEQTGYVALSAEDEFELSDLRLAVAKNLPEGVDLIVYVTDPSQVSGVQSDLGQYLGDRLKFLTVPDGADVIWARDSLPFPVYLNPAAGAATASFGLVDSIYTQDFEPDSVFAQAFSLPMTSTNTVFRGGSLLFDLQANCYAENAREVQAMQDPQTFFKTYFGCATVTILDHEGGIGDIDERLKFLTGNEVLTDNDSYATILKGKGYDVHMIPTTGADFETYMNTLLVNGTLFVPQMGISADQDAINAYQALGFKAIGVNTKTMADDGQGNIHCVTMNYPQSAFTPNSKDPRFVEFK